MAHSIFHPVGGHAIIYTYEISFIWIDDVGEIFDIEDSLPHILLLRCKFGINTLNNVMLTIRENACWLISYIAVKHHKHDIEEIRVPISELCSEILSIFIGCNILCKGLLKD